MTTRRNFLALAAAAPIVLSVSRPAFAAKAPVFASDGVAINGFDPVAYFTDGKPVRGNPDLSVNWQGAALHFSDTDHKAMFEADPEKYAPKYGGYCAYAVSKGATAPTDPDAWTIHEGRLYLNFSTDVRSIWREDIEGNVARADANWPGVLSA